MNDLFFSQIDKRDLTNEIAEAVVSRLTPNLNPPQSDYESIQTSEALKLLGRSSK